MNVNIKNKRFKVLILIVLCFLFNTVSDAYAVGVEEKFLEFVGEAGNKKVAYLTFDDGPSIYTEQLLDVLNEYEVPGIFFILGTQLEYMPNADEILNRIIDEGHYIALHTMTHDRKSLYHSEKSPATFTREMLELRDEVQERTDHLTNLCRAPYGKKGHFKAAHYKSVDDAGLYCVDWHVDSRDWAKKNATQIYAEVVSGLESFKDADEVVLLFHEYQRTIDAMPLVIEHLIELGYTFEPYVEGKVFDGLN